MRGNQSKAVDNNSTTYRSERLLRFVGYYCPVAEWKIIQNWGDPANKYNNLLLYAIKSNQSMAVQLSIFKSICTKFYADYRHVKNGPLLIHTTKVPTL